MGIFVGREVMHDTQDFACVLLYEDTLYGYTREMVLHRMRSVGSPRTQRSALAIRPRTKFSMLATEWNPLRDAQDSWVASASLPPFKNVIRDNSNSCGALGFVRANTVGRGSRNTYS